MKKALLIIDMQNGFIKESSPFCIKNAKDSILNCAKAIEEARKKEIEIIFVNRSYNKDGSDIEYTRKEVWEKMGKPLSEIASYDKSSENPKEIGRKKEDRVIIKPRFSAFFATNLDLILRRLGIVEIILIGTTTPNCIRTTCYDGISLDYKVTIIEDCTSSNTKEIQDANINDMKNIGANIISLSEFLGV